MAKQKFTGVAGLPLPRRAVRVLRERGIFAHAIVSVERQHWQNVMSCGASNREARPETLAAT
jgi:hypothetical protein